MVHIQARYDGDLRCTATHGPSGATLVTDAPTDNMGKGEAFSPTDLMATALVTCVLTTMAIAAKRKDIPFSGATASVTKEMTTTPPRRVARLNVTVHVPATYNDRDRALLEGAAHGCPVHRSLHPDVEAPITIHWGSAG